MGSKREREKQEGEQQEDVAQPSDNTCFSSALFWKAPLAHAAALSEVDGTMQGAAGAPGPAPGSTAMFRPNQDTAPWTSLLPLLHAALTRGRLRRWVLSMTVAEEEGPDCESGCRWQVPALGWLRADPP